MGLSGLSFAIRRRRLSGNGCYQAITLRMQVKPRPLLRIWLKNGSTLACPRLNRVTLPH
jgi:hypothetical protein